MYNQIPVFKGGYSTAATTEAIIDTSHFLTPEKASHLFVNEIGDDSKNGTLDMKNNRITNVSDPTDSSDSSNKKYVDQGLLRAKADVDQGLLRAKADVDQGLLRAKADVDAVTNRITDLEKVANRAKGNEYAFRSFVDNHKWDAEAISSGTININRLPYHQYGFILNIGTSASYRKTTSHSVKLPFYQNISYKKINLQLTSIRETRAFDEDIYCNVKMYTFENIPNMSTMMMVIVDTHIYNGQNWALNIKAHLLITVFDTEMLEIADIN